MSWLASPFIGLFGLVVLTGTVTQAPPAKGSARTMRTLDASERSGGESARQVILRTADEWQTFWRQHAGARALPAVTFPTEMVVAACLGSRLSAGFSVEITSVGADQGTVLVRYRERVPPADAITAQVITSPCHIVAVPSLPGTARFERIQ